MGVAQVSKWVQKVNQPFGSELVGDIELSPISFSNNRFIPLLLSEVVKESDVEGIASSEGKSHFDMDEGIKDDAVVGDLYGLKKGMLGGVVNGKLSDGNMLNHDGGRRGKESKGGGQAWPLLALEVESLSLLGGIWMIHLFR